MAKSLFRSLRTLTHPRSFALLVLAGALGAPGSAGAQLQFQSDECPKGTTQTGNSGGLGETLYSFAGDDVLTGAGASDFDTFYYRADLNAGGWGDDSITDFVDGNDLIVLDGYGWDDYSDFVTAGGSISGSTISYAGSSIDVAFAGGGTLDSSDLIFVA